MNEKHEIKCSQTNVLRFCKKYKSMKNTNSNQKEVECEALCKFRRFSNVNKTNSENGQCCHIGRNFVFRPKFHLECRRKFQQYRASKLCPKTPDISFWAKKSPKTPEISPKMDENGRNLTSSKSKNFFEFFFKFSLKNFQLFSDFFLKIIT